MIHIFTEIINCGKIGRIALKSYCKHNNYPVNVYGTKEDFECVEKNDKIIFHEVTDSKILNAYKVDHGGLPMLWAKVIKESGAKTIIHFDSDVLFRAAIVDETVELSKEYDLIGPMRHQKQHCKNIGIPHTTDTIATHLWCINTEKLSNWSYDILSGMCGLHIPFTIHGDRRMLDYFDPVSYDILRNNGKMYHFDFNDVGAVDKNYSRENIFSDINCEGVDFGTKLVHFAGVGSGMDAYLNRAEHNEGYASFAVKRYALFCKIFYNEDLGMDLNEFKNTLNDKDLFLRELV